MYALDGHSLSRLSLCPGMANILINSQAMTKMNAMDGGSVHGAVINGAACWPTIEV